MNNSLSRTNLDLAVHTKWLTRRQNLIESVVKSKCHAFDKIMMDFDLSMKSLDNCGPVSKESKECFSSLYKHIRNFKEQLLDGLRSMYFLICVTLTKCHSFLLVREYDTVLARERETNKLTVARWNDGRSILVHNYEHEENMPKEHILVRDLVPEDLTACPLNMIATPHICSLPDTYSS